MQRHGPISSTEEILRHPVIGYVDSLLDIPALRFLDEALSEVRPAIQTNNITGQWMAAVAGLGVAALPSFIAEPDPRLIQLLEESVTIRRKYWLAVPRELQCLARIRVARQEFKIMVLAHPYLEAAFPLSDKGL